MMLASGVFRAVLAVLMVSLILAAVAWSKGRDRVRGVRIPPASAVHAPKGRFGTPDGFISMLAYEYVSDTPLTMGWRDERIDHFGVRRYRINGGCRAPTVCSLNSSRALPRPSKPKLVVLDRDSLNPGLEPYRESCVVLCINGDPSFDISCYENIRRAFPALVRCYATNLLREVPGELFRPLPLGIPLHTPMLMPPDEREEAYHLAAARARPWAEREPTLLIPPMSFSPDLGNYDLRVLIHKHVSAPEFAALVTDLSAQKVSLEKCLELVAQYRFILSPPGVGYDCYRTWEALALGTVPLVHDDGLHDMRLYDGTEAKLLRLDTVTPEDLRLTLATPPRGNINRRATLDSWLAEWKGLM